MDFHTYQLKQDKPFRVVLPIHHSVDIIDLKREIEEHGHQITNIYNIKQRTTGKPLSLFRIDLKSSENNADIYKIETLQSDLRSHTKNEQYRSARDVKDMGIQNPTLTGLTDA